MFFKFSTIVLLAGLARFILATPVDSVSSPEKAASDAALSPSESEMMLEQLAGFYQGDMRFADTGDDKTKNVLSNTWYRWPDKIVYYEIDSIFDANQKAVISEAMATIQAVSCVRFKQRTVSNLNYIYVTGVNSGCWSYVGCIRGRQDLNLQLNGCVYRGTAMHEFLHALGIHHQHSAYDRDSYIRVLTENVIDEYVYAFDKYTSATITDFGLGYDYGSILHYGPLAFSKNGRPTIQTLNPGATIGQRTDLSAKDILKIRNMYNC